MRLCFARRLHRTTPTGSEPLSDNEISTDPLPQEGLNRVHDQLAAEVAAGHVPGLVFLVAHGDDVHVDAIGTPSLSDDTPLARDAIFRIASLTKPIVAAAALALVEEGILEPAPADRRAGTRAGLPPRPAFSRRRAGRHGPGTPAHRAEGPPQLHPGLRFTDDAARHVPHPEGGIRAGAAEHGWYPLAPWSTAMRTNGSPGWGRLPLMHQPGERWMYNTSGQVLGILVAGVCGHSLESVLRTADFRPARDDRHRVLRPAGKAWPGCPRSIDPIPTPAHFRCSMPPADSWWGRPPLLADGAGWLVSTIDDYWSFVSMVLAGGTGHGQRILFDGVGRRHDVGPPHPRPAGGHGAVSGASRQLGLRLAVPIAGSTHEPFPCGIGWNGGTGTTWRSDARRHVTAILFTQRQANSPSPPPVIENFWGGVNAATR